MPHYNISITGKVQSVYYRAWTRETALDLGLKGFVMNKPDGSVYIEAEGDENNLNKLVELCHSGPEKAVVEKISFEEGALKNFKNFEIRRD